MAEIETSLTEDNPFCCWTVEMRYTVWPGPHDRTDRGWGSLTLKEVDLTRVQSLVSPSAVVFVC